MSRQRFEGVNIGGWLIVEPWLTPTLFDGTECSDEWSLAKKYPQRLTAHRNAFITEADFRWLSEHSVTHVRIPIGYWLFEDIDGYIASVSWLDMAFEWAEKYSISVLVDLHGAPGSQNGHVHSGKIGQANWFNNTLHQATTIDLLCRIAERYNGSRSFWGIEILNEPQAQGHYWQLVHFYRRAYTALRRVLRPGVVVIFHDGFHPWLFTGAIVRRPKHPVIMDVHWYHGGYRINNLQAGPFLQTIYTYRRTALFLLRIFQPVIVGEWSSVLPQELFDRTQDSKHEQLLNQAVSMQRRAYQLAEGHFYWNYKAERGGMWNYKALIEKQVILATTREGK